MNREELQQNELDEQQRIGETLRCSETRSCRKRSAKRSRQRTGQTLRCSEARLARHAFGRVLLHLACLAHDGKWRWHGAGIRHELSALAHPHHPAFNQ